MQTIWLVVLGLSGFCVGQLIMDNSERSCKVRNTTADCSRRNLTTIPNNLPCNITRIDLSRNNFTNINSATFKNLPHLISIDLSYNKIQDFDKIALASLKRLRTLKLFRNKLPLTKWWCVESDPFGLAPGLTILNLKQNCKPVNYNYLDACLRNLKNLSRLYIDGVNNANFPQGMSKLVSLKTIDLSSSKNLRRLDKPVFDSLSDLPVNTLMLASCNITTIGIKTFSPLVHLTKLDLSSNLFLTVKRAVHYEFPKSLKMLKINKVQTEGPTEIKKSWFTYLNKSEVETLFMDFNQIGIMKTECVKALPDSLKTISLKHNLMSDMSIIARLHWLPKLETFDAYSQGHKKSVLTQNSTENMGRNKNDISNGSLGGISVAKSLRRRSPSVKLPKDLVFLRLTYFSGHSMTQTYLNFSQNTLRDVDLSNNNLGKLGVYVLNLNQMLSLNLSANQLVLDVKFFTGLKGLERLDLAQNNLESSLSTDTNCALFKPLTKLRHLNLSSNGITTLRTCTFSSMESLSSLILTSNKIVHLEARLGHMLRLEILDLRNNLIPYLHDDIIHDLVKISEHTNLSIRLGNNSLVCNCDSLHFLQWAHHTKTVNLSQNLTCQRNKTSKPLPFGNLDNLLREMERSCRSYVELIVGISLAIMAALLVVSVGLVYRYRWKLRYFYYMVVLQRKRRKDGYHQIDGSDNCDFEYDLFVSYADDDRAFVINDMINVLEKGKGIRLCVHHRDFMAGDEIAANITRAIHSSRKTVMLLSENFLNSYWCMYEFNMVRMEGIYSGRDVLLVIMYTPVGASKMPYDILHVLQTNSYLERPQGEQGVSDEEMGLFWENLVQAIGKDNT